MSQKQKHSNTLELYKIIEQLQKYCYCEETIEKAAKIQPATSFEQAVALTQYTADAYTLSTRFGYPSILKLTDPRPSLKRADRGSMLTLRELLDVLRVLKTIRSVKSWHRDAEEFSTSLDPLLESLFPQKSIEDRLTASISSEETLDDNASTELANIRRKIRNIQLNIRSKLDNMIKSPTYQKYLQDSIVTMRDGRFVVPVKSEYRAEVKGLVHDTSASGSTFFVEPIGVVEANNEIKILEGKELQEIERIIAELSAMVAEVGDSIAIGYEAIIELDLYFAKSRLGDKMRATIPLFNDERRVVLRKARHPLIEPSSVVPIDIAIGGDYDTLVITGPNTGGKTVAIKTLGLISLMAMCGLMIPVSDGSEVSFFYEILADIGDEQSIEQSLSTFSSHMVNIVDIIEEASVGSLVLLDELGAGTDPVEGAALAVSIMEKLRSKGALIGATTHYPEVKVYALDTKGVENASCEFDIASLRPTYRLITGIPGRSNAFLISEKLGLSGEIIERAKDYISAENTRFEDVVTELEQNRQLLEEERKRAEKASRESEMALAQMQKDRINYEKQLASQLEAAQSQAREMIEEIEVRAQVALEELEAIRKQKDKDNFNELLSKARLDFNTNIKDIKNQAGASRNTDAGDYKLPRPLQGGDIVFVRSMNKEALVTKTPDKNATKIQLQVGNMKMTANIADLMLADKVPQKKKAENKGRTTYKGVTQKSQRSGNTELDIRGYDSEDGVMKLNAFIDNAVMTGMSMITIIHGKGTGVLRNAVHTRLRAHKQIKSFRLGRYGEGEDGVTIAELK